MVMSAVWLVLIFIGSVFYILSGNIINLNNEIINSAVAGINLITNIIPLMLLWCGLMQIANKSGLLEKISNLLYPLLHHLFPTIKKEDKALGYIASNIAANSIGLGSAATPFGLKAMEEMNKSNDNKGVATKSMITFLVLNTSGVTIIPTTVIALRQATGSANPTAIIITSVISTFMASFAGLLLDYFIRRGH